MEITIKGLKVNYIKEGPESNTNILILHGWGVDHTMYKDMIAELSKKFTTYAIDFPGFGKSDEPDSSYTVEDYAKLTLEFIEKNNMKNVVLIGHSFGGRVIIKLTGKLGFEAKKIILVDSAGIKPKKTLKRKLKEVLYKVAKGTIKLFLGKKAEGVISKLRNKMGSADYVNANDNMKEVFKNVINEDLTEYLPNIKASTLLIWGTLDTETPLSDAKIMESKIPDAGLVQITNGGHFSFLNNPVLFNAVVNKFLEGCD